MFIDLLASIRKKKEKKYFKNFNQVPCVISFITSDKRILIFVSEENCSVFFKKKISKSKIVRIFLDGDKYYTRVQEFQVHSFKKKILSIMFIVVLLTDKVIISVPLKIVGNINCKALQEGCSLKQKIFSIAVTCLVGDVPDFLEVDISSIKQGSVLTVQDVLLLKEMSFFSIDNLKEECIIKIS